MPAPVIVAAIGRGLAALVASAGEWAAAAGARAVASGATGATGAATKAAAGSAAGAAAGATAGATAGTATQAASAATVQQAAASASAATQAGAAQSAAASAAASQGGSTAARQAAAAGTGTSGGGSGPSFAKQAGSAGTNWNQRFNNIWNTAGAAFNGFNAPPGGSGGSPPGGHSYGGGSIPPGPGGFGGRAAGSIGGFGQAVAGNLTLGTVARAASGDPAAITKTLVEMAKMPDRLIRFSDSLIRAQEGITALSGTMSEAVMRLSADRFRRDLRSAAMTSGTFSRLTASQSQVEGRLQPYQAMYQNLSNLGGTVLNKLLEQAIKAVEYLSPINEIRDKINEWLGSDSADVSVLSKAISDIASRPTPPFRDPPGARRMPPLPPVVNRGGRRP